MRSLSILSTLAAALLISIACESRLTGNEGNFQFSYPADDRLLDFNKPVAVGASIDLRVADAGDGREVTLDSVVSADSGVFTVGTVDADRLTLTAAAEGNVLITVSGAVQGRSTLTDSLNLNARIPDRHNLAHSCGADGDTAYLTGPDVYIGYDFELANGQPVIGYGYFPVSFDSDDIDLDTTHTGQAAIRLASDVPGTTQMSSELDGTSLELVFVDETAIDGVQNPVAFVIEDIDVGDRNAFHVLPTAQGRTVCQAQTQMTVTSDTPELCEVRTVGSLEPEDVTVGNEFGWFDIEGKAEGDCTFTVTYTASGATGTFSYPIEP